MPDRLSYDEAMLYANRSLKIQDLDLKQGAVETYTIKTSVGEIKKPWGMEGGFAVVYKYRTQSGYMKAMRCFRVAMNADTQFRYERMSHYFRQYVPDITVDFHYYENGILVKESSQSMQKKICPVIVMEWIDGVTLLDKVDELCKQRNKQILESMAQQWLGLLNKMGQAHMAHGDLAGVNVMVRKNGQLVLIDYDGVYIPEFAGLPQVVLGQLGYQHPDMTNRLFSEQMDDFSALVIYLTLLALSVQPELWSKYVQRNARGQLDGNMLFTGDDFAQPDQSLLFAELLRSSDPRIRDLTQTLLDACRQHVVQVRFPMHLLDPDHANKQALQQLERAIQLNDDNQIIKLWVHPLASYRPAQRHLPRVTEAKRRIAAVDSMKRALATHDIFQIAAATISELVTSRNFSSAECEIMQIASDFVQAYNKDDDEKMFSIWQEIQIGPYRSLLKLGSNYQQRLNLALQRKAALSQFRFTCYRSNNAHEIVNSYDPILDSSTSLSKQERELLMNARRYLVMYDAIKRILLIPDGKGDSSQLAAIYDEELDKSFNDFNDLERKQITVMRNYGRLDRALLSKAYRLAIVTARELELQTYTPITDSRLSIARKNFIKAFEAKNLQVQIHQRQAHARWDWPNDELIQFAVVVWREDRWPLHPKKDDPGRVLYRINRGFYEQYGGFQFPIRLASQIYIQVYLAITEFIEQTNEMYWFYSRGNEPSSKWPVLKIS